MYILKFLIAGVLGLGVNLGTSKVLHMLGVSYLAGSVAAFLVAMLIGFVLQKYWTFKDRTLGHAHTQFMLYGALACGNLVVNTVVVYLLVEYAAAHYLVAQAIGAGTVAITSYIIYRFYIFTDSL